MTGTIIMPWVVAGDPGALVTGVLRVTYNPLLRTVSVELLK
jgi:hypothetical protein